MSDNLNTYFSQYTEKALQTVRECHMAKNYYEGIADRLAKGHDFSNELPDIKKVGLSSTKEIVQDAIKEFSDREKNIWELPNSLAQHCKSKITNNNIYGETLPQFHITHIFTTPAGKVQVVISTKGDNYTLNISSSKNKMAAEAAKNDLDKLITLSFLMN